MQQTQKNEFQIAGKILEILPPVVISPKLTKRCFTLEAWSGNYSNPVIFDLKNERGKQLDGLIPGNWVICTFELLGRKIEKEGQIPRYYNNLNCLTVVKG